MFIASATAMQSSVNGLKLTPTVQQSLKHEVPDGEEALMSQRSR
jgi:hypothetical protein